MMVGRKAVLALCSATLIGMAGLVQAQAQEPAEERQGAITTDAGDSSEARGKERWQAMSEEERQAHRQERRERWEAMSAEEREAHRQKMKEHWDELSPEEREAMKERKHKRHGANSEERSSRRDRAREASSE